MRDLLDILGWFFVIVGVIALIGSFLNLIQIFANL